MLVAAAEVVWTLHLAEAFDLRQDTLPAFDRRLRSSLAGDSTDGARTPEHQCERDRRLHVPASDIENARSHIESPSGIGTGHAPFHQAAEHTS
jgi:hypothetical protein